MKRFFSFLFTSLVCNAIYASDICEIKCSKMNVNDLLLSSNQMDGENERFFIKIVNNSRKNKHECRWEYYFLLDGINSTRVSSMVYDEALSSNKPNLALMGGNDCSPPLELKDYALSFSFVGKFLKDNDFGLCKIIKNPETYYPEVIATYKDFSFDYRSEIDLVINSNFTEGGLKFFKFKPISFEQVVFRNSYMLSLNKLYELEKQGICQ